MNWFNRPNFNLSKTVIKKFTNIILVFLLLLSTSGITVYKHFCGNSLVSESIGIHTKKCCNANCKGCRDESITFKITDHFEANNNTLAFKAEVKKLFNNSSFAFVLCHFTLVSDSNMNLLSQIKICNSPPLIAENPTAKLQVFRI